MILKSRLTALMFGTICGERRNTLQKSLFTILVADVLLLLFVLLLIVLVRFLIVEDFFVKGPFDTRGDPRPRRTAKAPFPQVMSTPSMNNFHEFFQ